MGGIIAQLGDRVWRLSAKLERKRLA